MDLATAIFVAGVFFVAGGVKGMAGLGLPTVAMGLLSLVFPTSDAASLLLLPSLVTNMWQAFAGRALRMLVRRLWVLWVAAIAGTLVGVLPGMSPSASAARGALGAVLIAYGAWGLLRPAFDVPTRRERWLGALTGYVTGTITAATGVFVIPAVPYLQGLRLDKDEFVQALGLCFTVSTIALAAHLQLSGELQRVALSASAAALVPCLAGLRLGEKLRRRVSDSTFRRGFYVALTALGCGMLALATHE